jgi:hypothetical protein
MPDTFRYCFDSGRRRDAESSICVHDREAGPGFAGQVSTRDAGLLAHAPLLMRVFAVHHKPIRFVIIELSNHYIRLFLRISGRYLSTLSKANSDLEVAMQIEIQARNFSITRGMHAYIKGPLRFALGACYRHIKRMLVRPSDINGPRGGNDKHRQLEVIVPGQMNQSTFESKLLYAETTRDVDGRPDYWYGYMRGLRRAYHGEQFGTDQEHALWLALEDRGTRQDQERGRGYRDGFKAV